MRVRQLAGAIALTTFGAAAHAGAQNYQRAEQFLSWNALRLMYHDQVAPTFYRDSTRFWYRVATREGFQFITVNPATGAKGVLFDNTRLAAALSTAADTVVAPGKLPFQSFTFDGDGRDERAIRVRLGDRGFRCELATYQCARADTLPDLTRFVRSPDEQWDAFSAGGNLWIRPVAGGDSIALTTDGADGYAYGVGTVPPSRQRTKSPNRPIIVWSPDSRRIAVQRIDERGVGKFHVISMTSTRPVEYTWPYALPGDSVVVTTEWYVADVAARRAVRMQASPQPQMTIFSFGASGTGELQWSAAGDRVFFTHVTRGPKQVHLMSADAAAGQSRVVLGDSSATYVLGGLVLGGGAGANWRLLANGEILWFSERDGFGHLYRFNADGGVRNQVTSGAWTVSQLLGVDERLGRVYFTAKGREKGRHPDYNHLYSAALDGTGTTLLSPEAAEHVVTAVPSGKYFIDSYSTVSTPPVTVLRNAAGGTPAELERADITDLLATGWRPGEVFMAKARDGVTDVWGIMWKPSTFDSTKRYPVIDHIYPGPLITPAIKSFYPDRGPFNYPKTGQVQAMAELGFVVVSIDALGNTARAKALYTSWYGDMGDNGIPDHVAVLKQLGVRVPQLDLDRVGIYGHSGGGFSSTDALLRNPSFYKVAVSTSGNHDNRTYYHGWGERFQGLLVRDTVAKTDNYANAANKTYASQLDGKLFLIHGDLDDNVHPAHTIALVDALIKANKSFDLLIVPDANHNLTGNPYVIRRTWDYFVANLLGGVPPKNYLITPPAL